MNRQERRQKNKQEISVQTTNTSVWNYPIPPPSDFEKYPEDVRKTFLSEWEKQGDHRRKSEIEIIKNKTMEIIS